MQVCTTGIQEIFLNVFYMLLLVVGYGIIWQNTLNIRFHSSFSKNIETSKDIDYKQNCIRLCLPGTTVLSTSVRLFEELFGHY